MESLGTTQTKHIWPMVRLGDVCRFRRGLTYAKDDEVEQSSNVVLRSNNIELGTGRLDFAELKYLREDFHISADKRVISNSLLMCMANGSKPHLGKVALIEDDLRYAFGGFMGLLLPNGIDSKYLFFVLTSPLFKECINELQDGANINNLKFSDIADFAFPLPPLHIQHEIVTRLERELAEADSLAANFKRIAELADAEFKAELDETFDKLKGNTVTLGEVCDIKTGKKDVNQGNPDGPYPFFTCARTPTRADTYSFDCSALLIAGNGDVGFTQKYEGKFEVYQRTYVLYNFKGFHRDYIYYVLQSGFREFAGLNKLGAAMPYIKMGTLTNFPIPSIPISQQAALMVELDAASTRCHQLQAVALKGLHAAENLRTAILSEAFAQ